jgi:hypothetical protein
MSSIYKQIGNAVPVRLSKSIGEEIIKSINSGTDVHDEFKQLEECICKIIGKNAEVLFAPNKPGLTPYERAAGFKEKTRSGAKNFGNKLGKPVLEEIWNCSKSFTRVKSDGEAGKGGCDGYNHNELFESKSRFHTMKGTNAVKEIRPKLEHAISERKKFTLLVLVDLKMLVGDLREMCKKNGIDSKGLSADLYARLTEIDDPHRSRNIPLHWGQGLKKIQTVTGYDEKKHRWISGLEAFKYLFPKFDPEKIRELITKCIEREFQKRGNA